MKGEPKDEDESDLDTFDDFDGEEDQAKGIADEDLEDSDDEGTWLKSFFFTVAETHVIPRLSILAVTFFGVGDSTKAHGYSLQIGKKGLANNKKFKIPYRKHQVLWNQGIRPQARQS